MSTRTSNFNLIKPALSDSADITQYNSNWDTIDSELAKLNTKAVMADSDDGIKYYVTAEHISQLYNGLELTIIPSATNANSSPTLNVNSLGFKPIRLPLSSSTGATITVAMDYISVGHPIKLIYDAEWSTTGAWLIYKDKPSASDLYGTVPVSKGGTGGTTALEARESLEITPANIGALPTVLVEGEHYGTEEQRPEAGTKGRIYFQVITA